MKILVANIGSTSLKYRLFSFREDRAELVARGGFERVTDYSAAIDHCLAELEAGGFVQKPGNLSAVAFKTIMAKGLSGCVRVDEEVLAAMEAYSRIAPAHNPPYIDGIRAFSRKMPAVPMIALFETAFYQWVPEGSRRYPVPDSWHEAGVVRFGFHGASHKFIGERSAELLDRPDVAERGQSLYVHPRPADPAKPSLRVISCHLGGSSSVSGLRDGVAIGNSFGTSPQSGLPQNNRSGDLDPFALLHIMREQKLTLEETENILSRDSGLKALSGGFNDLRDIKTEADAGNPRARLAIDVFVAQIRHWIGAFFLSLNGIDALVFTAGIGENNPWIRAAVCHELDQLGIVIDPAANEKLRATEGCISAAASKVKVLVIPTNEELVVAREAHRMLLLQTANHPKELLPDA
jgi:acetate kinase